MALTNTFVLGCRVCRAALSIEPCPLHPIFVCVRFPIHGGKRKRKCHLTFSEESSFQIFININPMHPIQYLYLSSYISSIVNSDLALPATVNLCPLLTAIYRLSNIPTQITFREIIIIQFVCSSRIEISQNILKADCVFGAKNIRF